MAFIHDVSCSGEQLRKYIMAIKVSYVIKILICGDNPLVQ
jgi:hypothetical protein